MSDSPTPLSAEQAGLLARLARHEDAGVHGGFAHWRALGVPQGSPSAHTLVRRGLAERRELRGGIHYRITAAGHQELWRLQLGAERGTQR